MVKENYMFKLKKKSISPLIATIFLVVIAVSLAAIVYTWVIKNTRDTVDDMEVTQSEWEYCKKVNLNLDPECIFDSSPSPPYTFKKLLLYDRSLVEISSPIVVTVIYSDGNFFVPESMEINQGFQGNVLNLAQAIETGFSKITSAEDISRIEVSIKECPDRVSYLTKCYEDDEG